MQQNRGRKTELRTGLCSPAWFLNGSWKSGVWDPPAPSRRAIVGARLSSGGAGVPARARRNHWLRACQCQPSFSSFSTSHASTWHVLHMRASPTAQLQQTLPTPPLQMPSGEPRHLLPCSPETAPAALGCGGSSLRFGEGG